MPSFNCRGNLGGQKHESEGSSDLRKLVREKKLSVISIGISLRRGRKERRFPNRGVPYLINKPTSSGGGG